MQAMGEQGVGPQRAIHVELEPDLGGPVADGPDDLGRPLGAAELLGVGLDDRLADARCRRRVELVRAVGHVEVDAEILAGEQMPSPDFELALADVAPRADDVGVDVDGHDGSGWEPVRFVHDDHGTPVSSAHHGRRHAAPCREDVQATFCATLVDEWIRLGVDARGDRSRVRVRRRWRWR